MLGLLCCDLLSYLDCIRRLSLCVVIIHCVISVGSKKRINRSFCNVIFTNSVYFGVLCKQKATPTYLASQCRFVLFVIVIILVVPNGWTNRDAVSV